MLPFFVYFSDQNKCDVSLLCLHLEQCENVLDEHLNTVDAIVNLERTVSVVSSVKEISDLHFHHGGRVRNHLCLSSRFALRDILLNAFREGQNAV
jgi:hypothetical protein